MYEQKFQVSGNIGNKINKGNKGKYGTNAYFSFDPLISCF